MTVRELSDAEVFGTPAPAPAAGGVGSWVYNRLFNEGRDPSQPEPPPPANVPTFAEARRKYDPDPYSVGNTIDRVGINTITPTVDLGTRFYNAGARMSGAYDQVPLPSEVMKRNAGIAELPGDASFLRRILESTAVPAAAGARGAYNAATTAASSPVTAGLSYFGSRFAAPTAGAVAGSEAGSYVGGETGELLGGLVGGLAGGALPIARGATADYFRDKGRVDPQGRPAGPRIMADADTADVRPSAGMLGNEDVQALERRLSSARGSTNIINDARQGAAADMSAAVDRSATTRGSNNVEPSPGTIGADVVDASGRLVGDARTASSTGQQQLMDNVGPRSSVDVSNVLAQLEDIRHRTDPGTYSPINTRVQHLREMLPVDAEGNVLSTEIPYERVKDWRTNLRSRSQSYDPVPGRYAREIYGETTNSMADTAAGQGVPRSTFDETMARTRAIEHPEGPMQTYVNMSEAEPSQAFNFVRGGERNPARLQDIEGLPEGPAIMGDYLRMLNNQTLAKAGARGPVNFADRWQNVHPDARASIAGPEVPVVDAVARLSRAHNYPTSQTGLGRTMGPAGDRIAGAMTASELGSMIGNATGIPGASIAGRAAGFQVPALLNYMKARALQSDTARDALAFRRGPRTIDELANALRAVNTGAQVAGGR